MHKVRKMKGLSPLVATVLLIAFTVGVGGIISVFVTGFTQSSSKTISTEGERQVICSNGAIDVTNLRYCNNNISGIIRNTGRITVGNITVQTIFVNASSIEHRLNDSGTGGSSSGSALALRVGQVFSFNVSIGASSSGAYDRVYLYTNCTAVTDSAISTDVTAC